MSMAFSVLGLIGGILCAVGDMLLDMKGKNNQKLGKNKITDSNWENMSEWRFKFSVIIVMIAVPMYAMGLWSLSEQIGGTIETILKPVTFVGSMGGFFIHAFLCVLPIVYKSLPDKELAVTIIDKMYSTIKIPFLLLYFVLTLATTILVIIAIANGSLDVPRFCVLLNPIVFMIIGVSLRLFKNDLFYDLPGICMPSLGLGMFELIGIINLT